MAEFCKECFKGEIVPGAIEKYIILSGEECRCEGCGKLKRVVLEYNHPCSGFDGLPKAEYEALFEVYSAGYEAGYSGKNTLAQSFDNYIRCLLKYKRNF